MTIPTGLRSKPRSGVARKKDTERKAGRPPDGLWTLTGHEKIVAHLARSIDRGQPSHSYLFAGPRGSGATELARAFAISLACVSPQQGSMCNNCASCALVGKPDHPDLITISANEKNTITIEDIRTTLRRLEHRATVGQRRVLSIANADRMTEEAANAVLKTLEEPPDNSVIILTAEHSSNLPATVTSRCAVFWLGVVNPQQITAALVASGFDSRRAQSAAILSDGRPAYALFLAQHEDAAQRAMADEELFLATIALPLHRRIIAADELADRIDDQSSNIFERWESTAHRLLLATCGLSVPGVNHDRIRQLVRTWQPQDATKIASGLIATKKILDSSKNTRLALESFLLALPQT